MYILLCLIIAFIWSGIKIFNFSGVEEDIYLSDLVLKLAFDNADFFVGAVLDMAIDLIPVFLFQMVFGMYIYRHFCVTGIYFFIRCDNRKSWFLKETFKLLGFSHLYQTAILIFSMIILIFISDFKIDMCGIVLVLYYVIIYSMWLFVTCLIINCIALKFGSVFAYVSVIGVQILFLGMFNIYEKYVSMDGSQLLINDIWLKLNPLSGLVFKWHSSLFENVNNKINIFHIIYDFNETVAILCVLAIFFVVLGMELVKRQDIIDENREIGGI